MRPGRYAALGHVGNRDGAPNLFPSVCKNLPCPTIVPKPHIREIAIRTLGLSDFLTDNPNTASGMIICAQAAGSGPQSPRNNHVARAR